MKHKIDEYEKDKRQQILQLNNDISKNNKYLELIKAQQVELNAESEKVKSKALNKMSELAQMLMAIDNIENKCFNRTYDRAYGSKSSRQAVLKHAIQDTNKPKNYNDFDERHAYAKKQLTVIEAYAVDFKEIRDGLMNDNEKDPEGLTLRQRINKNKDQII